MKFLTLFILLFPLTSFSSIEDLNSIILQSHQLRLAKSEQWLRFLHYDRNWIYSTSEADGSAFFLSKDGKSNPEKELNETLLELLTATTITETSALCRFPARARWLKEQLNLDESHFNFSPCKRYLDFMNEHSAHNVFLVFSSYYLESPASAFGHTMIRLGSTESLGHTKQSELLDTGIGYAANSNTENAMLYAFLGIVGGFHGTYSSIPYFYKIREYNDFESRDLWSYELNLTAHEKQKFLEHLWELGQTYFDYFYFSENCSYNLITLLDAVNPKWKLKSKIPYYVMPVDSIKAITKTEGLVKSITFRPSIKKIFEKSFSLLTKPEKKALLAALSNKDFSYVETLPLDRKTIWSDALIDLVDYKYAKEVLLENGPYFEWKKVLLNKRSTLGINPHPSYLDIAAGERPDESHGTSRMESGMGVRDRNYVSGFFNFRFAMHDLLDPAKGQPPLASLNFGEFSFHYNLQKQNFPRRSPLQFSFVKIFDIGTLNPWTEYHHPLSLQAEIGVKKFDTCLETSKVFGCMTPYFKGGLGVTKVFNKLSLTLLGSGDLNYSSRYKNNFLFGMGPKFIGLLRPTDAFSFGLTSFWGKDIINNKDYYLHGIDSRYYINEALGVRINNQYQNDYWKHDLSLLYYF